MPERNQEARSAASPSRRAYKGLTRDGHSPYVKFKWPLPSGKRPGKWVEVECRPVLCSRGLHGWKDLDDALTHEAIYEIELAGEMVEDGQKIAATKARLLRRIPRPTGELVQEGLRMCRICRKPHNLYKIGRGQSWADPDDGHSYMGESWESLARRLLAEKEGREVEPIFNWTGSL